MPPAAPPPPEPTLEAPDPPPSDARGRNLAIALWGLAAVLAALRLAAWMLPAAPVPGDPGPAAGTVLEVVDADGRPVPGARVATEPLGPAHDGDADPDRPDVRDADPDATDERLTDARGRVTLPRGPHRARVAAAGFARWTGAVPDAPRVRLALEVAAVVRGEVRTERGDPVPGARVRAVWPGEGDVPPHGTVADAAGRFRFDALSTGEWLLQADAPGHEPTARRLRTSTRFRNPPVVIELRPVGQVLVRVLGPSGDPAAGARVVLGGSGVWPPREATSDAAGEALFEDVPPGLYALRARLGDLVAGARATLLLDPGETREASLRLEPGRTIAVTVVDAVTDAPVADAAVTAGDGGIAATPVEARTGPDGRARLPGLPPGTLRLSVRADDRVPWLGAVAADQEVLAVRLFRTGRVTGRVLGPSGAPIAGADVEIVGTTPDGAAVLVAARGGDGSGPGLAMGELGVVPGVVPPLPLDEAAPVPAPDLPTASGASPIRTDADGRFEVEGVAPGALRVVARAAGLAPGDSGAFTLAPGGVADGIEVRLERAGTLRGRVVDARGFPVPGVEVRARSDRDPRPSGTVTGDDGTFTLDAVVGAVFVTASPPGLPAARARVDVAPGETADVELRLDAGAATLAARVLDERGFPVSGASVRVDSLRASAPARRHGVSSDDGTVELRGLPSPPWRLVVEHPGHATLRVPRVDEIDDEVQLVLSQAVSLGGRVFDEWTRAPVPGATVELRSEDGIRATRTDGEGHWRLPRVAPGEAEVVVRSPTHLPARRQVTLRGRPVDLGVLWLAPGGSVAGEVVDRWGTPVPGAEVAAGTPPGWATAAVTDAAGRFALDGLRPGPTHLTARHPAAGRARTREPVPVRKVEHTPGVFLRLPAAVDAEGAAPRATAPRVALDVDVESGPDGVLVTRVGRRSTAWSAGVREGDRVLSVDGVAVASAAQTRALLRGPEGEPVFLEVSRGDRSRTLTVPRETVR